MNFRPFLLLIFITAASASAFAQVNPNYLSVRSDTGVARSSSAGFVGSAAGALMAIEQYTFQLINAERVSAGLPALNWNEKIADLARLHSRSMADNNLFSHRGADGSMVDERADRLNLGEWRAIGENIAFMQGYKNPSAVAVEKWLLSSSHRTNLLNPQWSDSAIGVAMSEDGKCYFTQVFLLRR